MREGNQNCGNITQYSSGFMQLANGSTAQRPSSPANGMLRFNTEIGTVEIYQNSVWITLSTANTPSSLIVRDGSGNFAANTITAALTGNATSASKLATARALGFTGDATGSVSFDGSADTSVALTLAPSGITAGTYMFGTLTIDAKGRVTAATSYALSTDFVVTGTTVNITNTGVTAGTYASSAASAPALTVEAKGRLTSVSSMAILIPSSAITDANASTVANTLVKRDANGSFSANVITASLAGNASSSSKLATARTIAYSGAATGSITFDGSADVTIPLTLASNIVLPGTEGFVPPLGTTAQRPSVPVTGETRFNTDLGRNETWDGSDWLQPIGLLGTSGGVQYNNSGIQAGAVSTTIDATGSLTVKTPPSMPTAPSDGFTMFADTRAGRSLPAVQGNTGLWNRLQLSLATNRLGWYTSPGNGTTIQAMNFLATTAGTVTTRSVATTSFFTSLRRVGFVSAATAGSAAGFRSTSGAQYFRGNGTGIGGFDMVIQFGVSAMPSATTMRWAAGMFATTAALGNADISSLFNMLCFGANAADTNISFYSNSASGTSTVIPLGSNFPAKTVNTDFYQAKIYCSPNGSFVGYSIINLTTGASTTGTLTTNFPATTTLLCPQLAIMPTVATAAAMDFQQLTIETDS